MDQEKSDFTVSDTQTQQGDVNPADPHPHLHLAGRRVRHFLRPDGRKVVITSGPAEADKLRRTYSRYQNDDPGFDIVIHGDQEHIAALRETQSHHEQAREQLRLKHGADFEEFERVFRELDRLSNELHLISEHSVQLDANFEKYGYSAHLRTRETPNGSSSDLPGSEYGHRHRDWEAARHEGEAMRFWVKPVLRQYFHKGLLWRAQEAQEVASYELFIDLFYVAIIAISGDNSAATADGLAFQRFAITFILSWKFWSDISVFISWFDADDILRRIVVLFVLTLLLGLTTNISNAFTDTWTPLVAFFITARWFGSLYFLWMGYLIPMVRPAMIVSAITMFIPGVLWVASIFVSLSAREGLVWPALFLDVFLPTIAVAFQRGGRWMGPKLSAWFKETFEFTPGNNIEHRIERTNAFVSLVFGYSVVSLLYQSAVPYGLNAFFGKAVLGLIQAFSFNWLYFELDMFNLHVHAFRRHMLSAVVWMSTHLPFVMGFVLAGSALSKLVLAHDHAGADPEVLTEEYAARSLPAIPAGLRWYYCGGLGVALACTGIIRICSVFKTIPNQRCPRPYQLSMRFSAALAILLLPLAGDRLDSLQLVATTAALVALTLVFELLGNTRPGDVFWGFDRPEARSRKCTYSARCAVSKKDLENSIKNGEVLHVAELARKDGQDSLANSAFTM